MQFHNLLANGSKEEILAFIQERADKSSEADIWKSKIIPFSSAILSVLIPLRDQNLLITPEGKTADALDEKLFFRWSDLVSLKLLAFKLEESNSQGALVQTQYSDNQAQEYEPIDLEELGHYLRTCSVDLDDIDKDFPIAQYNLHHGVSKVIQELVHT